MKSEKCTWLGDLGIASYSGLGSWKSPWITRGGNLDHDKERLIDDGNCCLQLVCAIFLASNWFWPSFCANMFFNNFQSMGTLMFFLPGASTKPSGRVSTGTICLVIYWSKRGSVLCIAAETWQGCWTDVADVGKTYPKIQKHEGHWNHYANRKVKSQSLLM